MNDEDRGPKAALAFSEGVRALDSLERTLDSIRGRMGVLMSTGLIVAGLASSTLSDGVEVGWLCVAVVAMTVLVGASAVVIWPRTWDSAYDPRVLVTEWVDQPSSTIADMHRDLALWTREHMVANRERLEALSRFLFVGLVALAVEAVAFTIAA